MPTFSFIRYAHTAADRDRSHITDLDILTVGGQTRLYATTLYDGVISSWNINGSSLSLLQTDTFSGGLRAGGTSTLQTVTVAGGGVGLLTGGGTGDRLQIQTLYGAGGFGAPTNLTSLSPVMGGLHHAETITFGNGYQMVFGGLAGASGIGRITFDSNGVYQSQAHFPDLNQTYAANVTDLASATVGGSHYLFSASGTEHGVTSWAVANNGNIGQRANMGNDEGLWISAPSALDVAVIGSETFLIVASAGSSSLSVLQIGTDGSLTIRDHMLDIQESRFGGVADMEVLKHQGQTYVIVGGADDGMSVYVLLPGGQFVARAHIEDTTAMGLANVSAITAASNGNGIDIFVASSAEFGITRLRLDTGPAGITSDAPTQGGILTGTAGSDILSGLNGHDVLYGGAGSDVIRDGEGRDIMTGGAGADLFVLAYDDRNDVITDFEIGVDRIDLSGWPGLRSISQLIMTMTETGMTIRYGDEYLIINSASGAPIDHRQLTTSDLIGGTRIPQVILPGYAGPNLPNPTLPTSTQSTQSINQSGTNGPDLVTGSTIHLSFKSPFIGAINGVVFHGNAANDVRFTGYKNNLLNGWRGSDRLSGGGGSDRILGGDGNDTLWGGLGDDRIFGGRDNDLMLGGRGRDILIGGWGDDRMFGENDDDQLYGEFGNDKLFGSSGNDRLYGAAGNDKLFGEAGNDLLIGGAGQDRLFGGDDNDVLVGKMDNDQLFGGAGHDRLSGNLGNDKLFGQLGNDHLEGHEGNDLLLGGQGNDLLMGQLGNDTLYGEDGNDLLFGQRGNDKLGGGAGHDRLHGGFGDDQLHGFIGNDTLYGEIGQDTLRGGEGHDKLHGGIGNDILHGDWGQDTLEGQFGDDLLFGNQGNDTLFGGYGQDRLWGGLGNDRIFGNVGNDTLGGDDGRDALFGGYGDDLLFGNASHDTLDGGIGDDRLFGGQGVDTFVFNAGLDSVEDFEIGIDRIGLETDLWDGNLAASDIVFLFGSMDSEGATLDFGDGNVLQIYGVTDLQQISNVIEFV